MRHWEAIQSDASAVGVHSVHIVPPGSQQNSEWPLFNLANKLKKFGKSDTTGATWETFVEPSFIGLDLQ